jgi:tetratricopeptide (TPR) repeat protein
LTNLGALYLDMGEPQQAIEMLEKVRQAGRADQRALGALAQAYEQAGENAKAAELYAELVSEGGNTVPARRNLANNLLMAGRYDEALEQYQVLAGADPKNPENHLRLSQIYREKKRFEEARTSLQNAAALAPDSLEVKYNLVLLLESEGKSPEAIAAMEQLLKDSEKESYSPAERRTRAMFLEQLGVLNRMQERVEPAVEAFRAMSELDNDARPRALVQIIDTYRYGRDFDRAVERSKAAVGEFPTNRPVVSMAATVLAETGDAAAGAQFLEKLLDGSENDREILLSLAQVYEKGKMLDKAIEAVEKAEALAKTERERMAVWFTHGSVLERAKKYDEAEEKFNQVLKLDPDNAAALNYLGYMLADLNRRLDDAHDMIQKALDLDPDNGAYLDSLGWLYYRQERFELAERFLVRSLEQFKRDPVVHSHLGDVYAKLGRNAQAQEHWRRSLEEWERSPKADRDAVEIQKVREKLSQIDARSSAAESTRETTSKP